MRRAHVIASDRRERSNPVERNRPVECGGIARLCEAVASLRRSRASSPRRMAGLLAMTICELLILAMSPFLCGFEFVSAIKNERGNHYYKKGQLGKAKSAYESALKSDPASGAIAFNLGNAYYKEEFFDKSLAGYAQAVRDEKRPWLQARAYYNLGNAYARKDQTDGAIESYKQALRLNPADEDAKFNLEILKKKSQEQKKDQQKKQQQQQSQPQKQDQKQEQQNQDQSQGSEQNQSQSRPEQEGREEKESQGRQEQTDTGQGESRDQDQEEHEKEASESRGQIESEGEREQKTPAEIRADQILDALENQERQVLRLSGQKNPVTRARRATDKDW